MDAEGNRQEMAERVRYWLGRRNMTYEVFAGRLGKSLSWVEKICSGERALDRLSVLRQVADILDVTLHVLIDAEQAERATYCADDVEIAAITSALTSYDAIAGVGYADMNRPVDVDKVKRAVEFGWLSWQSANYKNVCLMLPDLLRDVHVAAATNSTEATRLVTLTYRLTAAVAHKLGQGQLAWIAADRGINLAERTGDNALIASAARTLAHAYMATGQHAAALNLSVQVAQRFSGSVTSGSPAFVSAYGMLLLKGSIAAARSGHTAVVAELQDEAASVARRAGEGDQLWSSFGPTNVTIHRVSAAADMHTAGNVLEAAQRIDPVALERLPRERRAHHLLDRARGYSQWDKKDQAISALLAAEFLAPQEIRCRPSTRKLVTTMLYSYRRGTKPPASLKRLASSIGIQT